MTTRIVTEKRTEWQRKSNKGKFFVLITEIKENMLLGHILNDRKICYLVKEYTSIKTEKYLCGVQLFSLLFSSLDILYLIHFVFEGPYK